MTSFVLKIIAIVTMTIDHYGYIVGGPEWMRMIGRLSFPIFAYLINESYTYTKDKKKLCIKLLVYGLILQAPFLFLNMEVHLNIFFTLFVGFLLIMILENDKLNRFLKLILFILIVFIAEFFNLDYGFYGVTMIPFFYYFKNKNKIIMSLFFIVLTFAYVYFKDIFRIQLFSIFSLIFIFMYNGREGYKNKYFFYLYYPVHILFLYVLDYFI